MKQFLNPCRRWRESLGLLVSGLLPELERVAVEDHLIKCAGCRQFHAELKTVIAPLVGWEKNFDQIKPSPAAQSRWVKAVAATDQPEFIRALTPKRILYECWRQLIWPSRRIWTGLAGVWLLILVVNLHLGTGASQMTVTASPHPVDLIQVLQEQQQVLAELTGQTELKVAEPPKRSKQPVTQPRSEWQGKFIAI
jgi:anti-sigma factor RsiW